MIKERQTQNIESSFVIITEMNSKHSQVYLNTHHQAWNNYKKKRRDDIPFGGHIEYSRDED